MALQPSHVTERNMRIYYSGQCAHFPVMKDDFSSDTSQLTQDACVCSELQLEGTNMLLASMACKIILWHFRLQFTWVGRLKQPKVGVVDLACRDTSRPIHLATCDSAPHWPMAAKGIYNRPFSALCWESFQREGGSWVSEWVRPWAKTTENPKPHEFSFHEFDRDSITKFHAFAPWDHISK